MSAENYQHTSIKQKAAHEFKEMTIVTVYLAFSTIRLQLVRRAG
jgi:hypothetical protein